jgi:hypothetical protein
MGCGIGLALARETGISSFCETNRIPQQGELNLYPFNAILLRYVVI